MEEKEIQKIIQANRKAMAWEEIDIKSDQMLKKPQPLLSNNPNDNIKIDLPRDFENLNMNDNLYSILKNRRSNRVYTEEDISLLELSFLCWAQQGVKGIRGNNYATLRTTPSAGARHPFELYLAANHIQGLEPAVYHYLPLTHQLELVSKKNLNNVEDRKIFENSLNGQKFGLKANVIFYYSVVPYRGEWRYSVHAHSVMLIDAGHVSENAYLAATALNMGACAIGAVDKEIGNEICGVDGENEFVFYIVLVGTINKQNEDEEQAFYSFLKEK